MSRTRNVLEWLERAAACYPDKQAFADERAELTFGELLDAVQSVGTAVANRLGKTRLPVAVVIDRNVESLVCMLGIAASGNFYVPVDAALPFGRLENIARQVEPALVIDAAGCCEDVLQQFGDAEIVGFDVLRCADADDGLLQSIRASSLDTDPLYALCTSGSTGVPKAVLISHRSVLDFIPVFVEAFSFGHDEVFGNQAPFDFDVSVKDIYSTLFVGATMHIIPRTCFSMPKLLPRFLDERGVTSLVWAVSALCVVSGFDAFKYLVPSRLSKVLFSGEAMPVKHLNIWRRWLPDALFVNLYGPTEVTCNCMYYIIDREFADEERLPLGVPFANEQVLVLAEGNRPAELGETGEICVSGTCLALGYYRDSERTEKAFVPNPLESRWPERIYRTGDLAKVAEDGSLVFAGRNDFQIKHMGHRIELEEIELFLGSTEGVNRACCLFDEARNKIVACYEGEADRKEIFEALGRNLPKYMIPNVFHRLDALPLNKNGKIDRGALRNGLIG